MAAVDDVDAAGGERGGVEDRYRTMPAISSGSAGRPSCEPAYSMVCVAQVVDVVTEGDHGAGDVGRGEAGEVVATGRRQPAAMLPRRWRSSVRAWVRSRWVGITIP